MMKLSLVAKNLRVQPLMRWFIWEKNPRMAKNWEEVLELKKPKQELLEAQQKAQIVQQKDIVLTQFESVWDNNSNERSKWW